MFHFLGFILIFILAILLIGLVLIANFVRKLFGIGKRKTNQPYSSEQKNWIPNEEENPHPKRKKVFSEDEGEYVEFEEVK